MNMSLSEMKAELARLEAELAELLENPKTRKVRNLMSGEEIEIAADTPWCCDPSTETYWSM